MRQGFVIQNKKSGKFLFAGGENANFPPVFVSINTARVFKTREAAQELLKAFASTHLQDYVIADRASFPDFVPPPLPQGISTED